MGYTRPGKRENAVFLDIDRLQKNSFCCVGDFVYLCSFKNIKMKYCKTFAALLFLAAWLPAAAQNVVTFRGDTVNWVRIAEDNSYLDWTDREMIYMPSAWIEFFPTWRNRQVLLARKAQRTQTAEMDSTTRLHLDSLMKELNVSRLATAEDLGITEKMIRKHVKDRAVRKGFSRNSRSILYHLVKTGGLAKFDRWLNKLYEENKDSNQISIVTDDFIFINININDKTVISLWRFYPDRPYDLHGNHFNLNIYRHLCALLPKTFDYSYETFQKTLIYNYYEFLVNDPNNYDF